MPDRCKYLLRIHLTFNVLTCNVRGHWDEFAVALYTLWCQGLGHGSSSITPSPAFLPPLVCRRRDHYLRAVVFAL